MTIALLRIAREGFESLRESWRSLASTSRFALGLIAILGIGMMLVGIWIHQTIQEGVVRNTASSVAIYINSTVDPYLQELAHRSEIGNEARHALDSHIANAGWREKVLSIKVWRQDGTIVYSDHSELIGKHFPLNKPMRAAWSGYVQAELNDLSDDENEDERQLGVPLLEVYTPVRATGTNRVIAVAEFYLAASELEIDLNKARRRSWYVICIVTGAMMILLLAVVKSMEGRGGSPPMLNDTLNLNDVHTRSVETNELFLRRVGMELHDGPAQLIGLALLRLDALRPDKANRSSATSVAEYDRIQNALRESLTEIRNISAGLALPELEGVSPAEALQLAARNHERRTGTAVACEFGDLPAALPTPMVNCLYRFAQEGLNNAYRHARGIGQTLRGTCVDGVIQVEVSDQGPGFDPEKNAMPTSYRLGLRGMRDRITTLGGRLLIDSKPGGGTRLTASFAVPSSNALREEYRV
jgi:signal transduction histidine kinase